MRTLLRCFLLACMALPAFAAVVPAAPDEQLHLAEKVRGIFEAKCLDCHGHELPRPKGKFGYVLDLQRVADNPDYVVRGDVNRSEMFLMVRDNEMPGEDANVEPLTPEEVATVARWIEVGAPAGPVVAKTPEKENITRIESPKKGMPLWKQLLRWVGRFHPVTTHFPIALMMVAVFAEGLAWWTRRESWLQTVRLLVILGALGALAAGVLGWINASFTSYVGESARVLLLHRWLGTSASVWALVCAVLVIMPCAEGSPERQRFRGALLVGAALIGIAGFLGSALIYGLDHYSWN